MNSEILYERLLNFAKRSQTLVGNLPKTVYNIEYGSQLIRSSASPGANYIEAVEASSPKDFVHRLKVCRKETKESIHWLRLIHYSNQDVKSIQVEINELIGEALQFIKIFTSSVLTAEHNQTMRKS